MAVLVKFIVVAVLIRGRPYMTSDGRGRGSAKSDFISKGSLIKHLMRGERGQKMPKLI